MLIEMSVTNFRSFRDEQTFSLVKGSGEELCDTNSFEVTASSKFQILRSAAIYGANASGKSNFLMALQAMKHIVVASATKLQRGERLPITPFRLSADSRIEPTEFEVSFIVDKVRYQYGFAATEERIHEEWLLAYPRGRAQHWFSRKWMADEQQYEWNLGNNLTGKKQLWLKSTRANALFLSTAVQLNSEQLQPLFDWFQNTLRLANVAGWGPSFTASLCESSSKNKILNFLNSADLHIDDILVEEKPFNLSSFSEEIPEEIRTVLETDMKDRKFIEIKTLRKDTEGKEVLFDFEDESHGTQKFFSFAGPWLDALENGYILFIDELHDSLHPRLVTFLVDLFHNSETNPKNAQLIFTTHETSILNQDVFRRDQIWFCEKNKDHSSMLYPLTDFSPRKGRENLELAYLSGRYGAVPFVKNLSTSKYAGDLNGE